MGFSVALVSLPSQVGPVSSCGSAWIPRGVFSMSSRRVSGSQGKYGLAWWSAWHSHSSPEGRSSPTRPWGPSYSLSSLPCISLLKNYFLIRPFAAIFNPTSSLEVKQWEGNSDLVGEGNALQCIAVLGQQLMIGSTHHFWHCMDIPVQLRGLSGLVQDFVKCLYIIGPWLFLFWG